MKDSFEIIESDGRPIKARARGVPVEDHSKDTAGVECRQDALVEIVHTLKQVLCVKG